MSDVTNDRRLTTDDRRLTTSAHPWSVVGGRWTLVLVLLLALGLRLLLWAQPLHQPANDEVEYIAVARDLLAGRGWAFYEGYRWLRAPLYPLFLAGSLWLAGGDLHRAALPNIALSVANVYLACRLARALVGVRAAPLAALITAVLWTNVTFASLYMAETLFTFLFQAGLLCLLRAADERGTRDERRGARGWAAGAGALLGLAALTRSAILMFLPLAALWLLSVRRPSLRDQKEDFPERASPPWPPRVARSLAFLVAAGLTIAPWTMRNALAYGEPILVETGLSYNLWAFNEPRESLDEIHRTLEAIPNPAARADYATARGLERLREDPAILARKLWPNWVFLARVKPIQDRFLLESYYATVELPLFAAALVFDDLLYIMIVLAATAQLVRRPSWLALAWLGYCLLTMLLTHGEARYRHFLFPVLIPFAAAGIVWALGGLRLPGKDSFGGAKPRRASPRAGLGGLRRPRGIFFGGAKSLRAALMIGLLWALFLWTVLTSYPWDWAAANTARGWHTLLGDARWAAGDRAGALVAYERAIAAHDVPDAWLRLGHARRAAGDLPGAAEAYRRAWRREPLYEPASTWYGDALRELGDEARARAAFAGAYADAGRVAAYAWRELRPAPRAAVDVGGGLDPGYIYGVYPAEELAGASARWSDGRARVRLAADAGPAVLELRLAAPRPDGAPVAAEVCAAGACSLLTLGGTWRTYLLPVAAPAAGELVVEVRSSTFAAADGRGLGVLIDRAALR